MCENNTQQQLEGQIVLTNFKIPCLFFLIIIFIFG